VSGVDFVHDSHNAFPCQIFLVDPCIPQKTIAICTASRLQLDLEMILPLLLPRVAVLQAALPGLPNI
jgi:hypothetical protein